MFWIGLLFRWWMFVWHGTYLALSIGSGNGTPRYALPSGVHPVYEVCSKPVDNLSLSYFNRLMGRLSWHEQSSS